jgi:hypothetical protein
MAIERNPNDPYRDDDRYRASDPTRLDPAEGDVGRSSRLETDLQADPELAEDPANGPKIALIALGIAVLVGAVFYGLNNSSMHQNAPATAQKSAPATAQNSVLTPVPAPPPAKGDESGKSGVTTGTAPSQAPPSSPRQTPPENK